MHRQSVAILLSLLCACLSPFASAAPIKVKYKEGVTHGFLVLSTEEGTPIAYGDSTEVVHGNNVTTHLIYHFKDGSLEQEDLVFSQRGEFRLITYHRIEKGPSFKNEEELSVDARSGQVNVKYTDDKGKEKFESEKMKLPPDLANGIGADDAEKCSRQCQDGAFVCGRDSEAEDREARSALPSERSRIRFLARNAKPCTSRSKSILAA